MLISPKCSFLQSSFLKVRHFGGEEAEGGQRRGCVKCRCLWREKFCNAIGQNTQAQKYEKIIGPQLEADTLHAFTWGIVNKLSNF
jgi:hypothetical protein